MCIRDSPLDYAYKVHSGIGDKAAGFLVNGKMVPFDYRLKHGDHVEVITKKNAKPKIDWLEHVMTSHAKNKIRAYVNKQRN
jgi:GTP pyrophosphokinase